MRLVDARSLPVCRRAWRRWWLGLVDADARDHAAVELCVLPRGTASDDGWLMW